jgi:hypothetical protein
MAVLDFGFSIPPSGIEGAIVPQAGKEQIKRQKSKIKGQK